LFTLCCAPLKKQCNSASSHGFAFLCASGYQNDHQFGRVEAVVSMSHHVIGTSSLNTTASSCG
jgi:hypothetical protein